VVIALDALPASFHGDPADRLIVATPEYMHCRSPRTTAEFAGRALSRSGSREVRDLSWEQLRLRQDH
jgi:hypothetical protein